MQLDLNLLTALNALLEEGSVSGAAQRLHLSEPAMSRSLGRIRRVTGDPILVRTGRTMTPTPRAVAMREEVRALVLRSAAVLAPETDLDLAALERTFSVRCHDALAAVIAPTLVREALGVAPRVSLRFLGETSHDDADLTRGAIDLEIGARASGPADVAHDHVGDDRMVGIARRDNPFVADGGGLPGFIAAPHVLVSRRGRLRDGVDDVLEGLGHSRAVVAAVASTAAALDIVRATDAVVIVASSVGSRIADDDTLRVFPLPFDVPAVPIVLAWHRRLTVDLAHTWLRARVAAAIRETIGAGGESAAAR